MPAEIVRLNRTRPQEAFARCRAVIRRGGIIVYPTDTFYALGADPRNAAAVKRIFEIKGREADQPILLLIGSETDVRHWAAEVDPAAERLMRRYWPGSLTLVFKAKAEVLPDLTGGRGTIGLRVPGSSSTRQLLDFVGTALTGTSANLSGEPSLRTADEAAAMIGGRVDMILDGGMTAGGKPSTVVEVATGRIHVIREGALDIAGSSMRNPK